MSPNDINFEYSIKLLVFLEFINFHLEYRLRIHYSFIDFMIGGTYGESYSQP